LTLISVALEAGIFISARGNMKTWMGFWFYLRHNNSFQKFFGKFQKIVLDKQYAKAIELQHGRFWNSPSI
jgi:hypothetical protein